MEQMLKTVLGWTIFLINYPYWLALLLLCTFKTNLFNLYIPGTFLDELSSEQQTLQFKTVAMLTQARLVIDC